MNPEQLIQRIEKLIRDANGRDISTFIEARSLAAEAARTPPGIRRDRLMAEALDMLRGEGHS